MSAKLKKVLSFLFIAATVTAVFYIAFSNSELQDAWGTITGLNLWWVAGIFGCWIVCTVFDGLNYWCYLRRERFRISIGRTINVALIGYYYSNITPSAAGGQPMQVNSLRKAGIPVGYGTMAVTIRFFANQFIICFISLVLFLFNRPFVLFNWRVICITPLSKSMSESINPQNSLILIAVPKSTTITS